MTMECLWADGGTRGPPLLSPGPDVSVWPVSCPPAPGWLGAREDVIPQYGHPLVRLERGPSEFGELFLYLDARIPLDAACGELDAQIFD